MFHTTKIDECRLTGRMLCILLALVFAFCGNLAGAAEDFHLGGEGYFVLPGFFPIR